MATVVMNWPKGRPMSDSALSDFNVIKATSPDAAFSPATPGPWGGVCIVSGGDLVDLSAFPALADWCGVRCPDGDD